MQDCQRLFSRRPAREICLQSRVRVLDSSITYYHVWDYVLGSHCFLVLVLCLGLVGEFENGDGPGKVSYANFKTTQGCTALHLAASAGKTRMCEYLIQKLKFDVNVTNDTGTFFLQFM